jgi:threonine/homoserine/homoserine lactone efflux protein
MQFLFLFLVGHAVCDFVLQGEVMGTSKSRRKGLASVHGPGFPPWYYWLGAHAFTHGGAVFLVSGLWQLGAIETVLHALIDHSEVRGRLSFNMDQGLHLVCKLVYVAVLTFDPRRLRAPPRASADGALSSPPDDAPGLGSVLSHGVHVVPESGTVHSARDLARGDRGQLAGIAATTGVLAANAMYFALSATGLAVALGQSSQLFMAIRWLGGAYLIWTGARMLARSFQSRDETSATTAPARGGRAFWQGFVAQAANPNLLVFFTAILPQFVDARAPLAGQVAVLAASSFAIEFAALSAYAALSHRAGRRAAPSFQRGITRIGGAFLIAAGAGLAALGRDAS